MPEICPCPGCVQGRQPPPVPVEDAAPVEDSFLSLQDQDEALPVDPVRTRATRKYYGSQRLALRRNVEPPQQRQQPTSDMFTPVCVTNLVWVQRGVAQGDCGALSAN